MVKTAKMIMNKINDNRFNATDENNLASVYELISTYGMEAKVMITLPCLLICIKRLFAVLTIGAKVYLLTQ
jgi:hypothetical protein